MLLVVLTEKIKELSDSLKRKELEISSQQSRHKKEMEKVEKKFVYTCKNYFLNFVYPLLKLIIV